METALQKWLEESGLEAATWQLVAQVVLSFEGAPQTAARRAAQALEGMRHGNGQWRKLAAAAP